MATGPTDQEKFARDNDWRKKEFQLKERDLELKRDDLEVKKRELALKEASTGGRRWVLPLLVSSGGWIVAIISVCVTLATSSRTEETRRKNQYADENRKQLQAGVTEYGRAILDAASQMHGLSSTYILEGTPPSSEQYHAMIPKLQAAYTEVALARQKLFVLEPEVAYVWNDVFVEIDDIYSKFQTMFYTRKYTPESEATRWSLLNCRLEEINTQSAVERVAKYLRPPQSKELEETLVVPKDRLRDCEKYSTETGTVDHSLRQRLIEHLRATAR